MDPVGMIMLATGVVICVVGWCHARAGTLTLGQGAFWLLIGAAFVALGWMSRWLNACLDAWGVQSAGLVPLALGFLLLVVILIQQAGMLGQLTRRSRVLAREIALLKQASAEGHLPAEQNAPDAGAGSAGSDS